MNKQLPEFTNNEFLLQVKQNNHCEEIRLIITSKNEDNCFKCLINKEIRLISERKLQSSLYEERKFCWSCALVNLYQLEESDYELVNKSKIINELRTELNNHD